MGKIDTHYQHWSRGLDDKFKETGHAPHDAATRLTEDGYVDIAFTPKFHFPKTSKYFGIGSCFARNIEMAMRTAGAEVLSLDLELPAAARERVIYAQNEVLTKFTPQAMETELDCALNDRPLDHGFIEINAPKQWNPQLHRVGELEAEDQLATAAAVRKTILTIKQADVVFITLGLTEGWTDTETGIPLNDAPIDWRYAKRTGRFEFRNSSYEECRASVSRTLDLVRKHSTVSPKFILTVSPVPLLRTFSDQDIIVANSYSKSTLRAVAQDMFRAHDDVDYFPSYEMVTYSPRSMAWRHDQRHVEPPMVWSITGRFRDAYVEG
ncbi:GSCFA domain-containing protein [Pseudooceanicola sp. C21-150M6]|uniref:GSCFA domain-containing protein n=1 Tax=Pseudooceanicola sp. C21-150M6 TaxID=3434355 RepID=UPI003D7FA6DA